MGIKKRTEITVETSQVLIIRQRKRSLRAWCRECGEEIAMVTVDEAAAAARVSSRTIYRWVEAGRIHFKETREGLLLICLSSLFTLDSLVGLDGIVVDSVQMR